MSINTIMCDDNTDTSLIDKIVIVCSALCNGPYSKFLNKAQLNFSKGDGGPNLLT